jgi:putative transposase
MLREFYDRNLPHIVPLGATFFVTFRLHGSLPKSIIDKLKYKQQQDLLQLTFNKHLTPEERHKKIVDIERQYFIAFNDALDTIKTGPHHLKIPALAQIIVDRMFEYDKKYYDLRSYVVMSNHVHALFDFSVQLATNEGAITEDNYLQLDGVMKLIKGGSAKYCNDWLKAHNMKHFTPFWEHESYDRFMRNQKHQDATTTYILNNPVKIGLCKDWREYPFVYLAPQQ